MPKKTTRAARTGQSPQRSKEEQWRKRMAAQAQRGASGVAGEPAEDDGSSTFSRDDGDYVEAATAPAARATSAATTTTTPRPSSSQGRAQSTAMAASQRRAATPARNTRVRMTADTFTMEEEMHYVRSDIRRLIILTAICLAVLIALAFVIPR